MAGESKLQTKIIKDLERSGWYVVKMVLTNKPGIPDTVCCKDGRAVWIEVKDEDKEAEPLQLHRHKELRDQAFDVFVIDLWERYLFIKHNYLK